ncbi:MAG: hypothetical protein DSZ03_06750 [Sulfurimonas sp.]|nr:MAG: hypothetical protein DSZ03_06750 [Sulfurimonas sp.]
MRQFIYTFETMSTPCELIVFENSKSKADSVAQAIVQESKRLEKKYSYYDSASLLHKINSREVNRLDSETKRILQRAKQYYNVTNGIFDITVATIKDLYTTLKHQTELETKKAKLLPFVGCEHFVIKKEKIIFDNPYTKIDLGGFVKEYAVDRAVTIVKKNKITAALMNFGGDIYAHGKKPDGTTFKVGIKDPKNRANHAEFVKLENEALTTSASYERNYTIENNTYSHIISKNESAQTPHSVTVISSNCVESGVYSTALMIDPTLPTSHRVLML